MYFNTIPKIYYDSVGDKNPKIVTNILHRVGLKLKLKPIHFYLIHMMSKREKHQKL